MGDWISLARAVFWVMIGLMAVGALIVGLIALKMHRGYKKFQTRLEKAPVRPKGQPQYNRR
jgi:UDP-N-acetylglucosamine enolpyruvyl transferase